ncbi:MAG: YdhR family protein [Pseudomonadota bacterium]
MPTVLFVRITTDLSADEIERRIDERRALFLEVPGLLQKIFGRDAETGDVCGVYFFENKTALENYRASDLAQSIAQAYEASSVRREVYEAFAPLFEGRRPFNG